MSINAGPVVLSYHDAIIYESDLELLDGPFWLNDSLIGFYVEYLEMEAFANLNVCFIRPEVTQCLKMLPASELPIFLDPLKFTSRPLALMPLNDCENPNTPGGSHWSLLVFSKHENTFYHFDSSQGTNHSSAQQVARKLADYLKISCNFTTPKSLQQSNSYDCGVFVLCNLDNVLKHWCLNKTLDALQSVKEVSVSRKRHDLRELIVGLSKE